MNQLCKECMGSGTIERDGKLYNCECYYIKQSQQSMPLYVQRAIVTPQHLELPIIQAIDKILFIKGTRADINAIIKAVMLKYNAKWIKLTSDAEIRNVYVGSMSKQSRSEDYTGEIYNNIQDLMDPPDLVIIHLGVISNKNKAAPGALEEALAHRINGAKPVWAFSLADNPFTSSSFAYSLRVDELINSYMMPVSIPHIAKQESTHSIIDVEYTNQTESKSESEHNPEREMPKREKEKEKPDPNDPLSNYGSGVTKKRTFK
jgi:hypothetical protein